MLLPFKSKVKRSLLYLFLLTVIIIVGAYGFLRYLGIVDYYRVNLSYFDGSIPQQTKNSLKGISGNSMFPEKYQVRERHVIASFGKERGAFINPYGIKKHNNYYYITDCIRGILAKYDVNFNLIWEVDAVENGERLYYPADLAVSEDGLIFVAEERDHQISIFDENGNFIKTFGVQGDGPGQLNYPLGLKIHNKELYVVDYGNRGVLVFDLEGNFKSVFINKLPLLDYADVAHKSVNLYRPYYIDIASNGRVAISDPSLNYVRIYDPEGDLLFEISNHNKSYWAGGDFNDLNGVHYISFLNNGGLQVADLHNSRILQFNADYQLTDVYFDPFTKPKVSIPIQYNDDETVEFLIGGALNSFAPLERVVFEKSTSKPPGDLYAKASVQESFMDRFLQLDGKQIFQYRPSIPLQHKHASRHYLVLQEPLQADESEILSMSADQLPEGTKWILDIFSGDGHIRERRVIAKYNDSYIPYSMENVDGIWKVVGASYQSEGYYFPSRQECLLCHGAKGQTSRENIILGWDKSMVRKGSLKRLTELPDRLPRTIASDEAKDIYSLAKSYVHTYCSACHNDVTLPGFGHLELVKDGHVGSLNSTFKQYLEMEEGGIIEKLKEHQMPPIAGIISDEERAKFIQLLEQIKTHQAGFKPFKIFKLKLKEHVIENDRFVAIQGLERFYDSQDKQVTLFANGYKQSMGQYTDGNLSGIKIHNPDEDAIELMADVVYEPSLGSLWTSWRLNRLYQIDSTRLDTPKVLFDELLHPLGVNANSKHIFIANYADDEIVKLDHEGNEIWRKSHYDSFSLLDGVYGIAIKDDKALYVSYSISDRLVKFDMDGKKMAVSPKQLSDGSTLARVQGIDFDKYGNLYAIDTLNNRIVVFDDDFNVVASAYGEEFQTIRGLSVDKRNGEILVSGFHMGHSMNNEDTGFWVYEPIYP